MKLRIFNCALAALMLALALASCTPADPGNESNSGSNGTDSVESRDPNGNEATTEYDVTLDFSGSACNISDTSAVIVEGKVYKIVKAGIYKISGTLDDGQIQVEVAKTEAKTDRVTLLLDNFTGSCSDSGVIYVKSADKVYIDLQKGSVNTLTDSSTYTFEDPVEAKPNACIYAADDLTIKGGGTLTVNASYNNGIGCKNDIDIKNGFVTVQAPNNAIKGNDSITICGDAVVTVKGADDAIKTESTDAGKGFILITDTAKVTVTCEDDAIQATQDVTITTGATVTVEAAQTAVNCDGTTHVDAGCVITK